MFPLQITNRKWRKWKFVDGFHRLPDSSSLFHVHGSTLSDRYYCEFLWSWEKFLWRWSTVQPQMRYATVVVKVHAGKTTKWAHALMIGKESLKGWWILTSLKKWKNFEKNFFEKWSEIVSTHRVYLFHLLWLKWRLSQIHGWTLCFCFATAVARKFKMMNRLSKS